jgi:hypothetical protein
MQREALTPRIPGWLGKTIFNIMHAADTFLYPSKPHGLMHSRENKTSCPNDFVGHPCFQTVKGRILDQNRLGNDFLRDGYGF